MAATTEQPPANNSNNLWFWFLPIILALLLCNYQCRRKLNARARELEENNRLLQEKLYDFQQGELELLEWQQQYKVLFEETHTIMVLIDPQTATIVNANPAACRFYQYSIDELRGMKTEQINALSAEEIDQQISLAENQQQQLFHFQHRLADGQLRDVEVHSSPIKVEGQSLLCSIVHDISQRKQAEQDLEGRHKFLQSVIDGVADPLMVISLDRRVLKMNRAARDQLPKLIKNRQDLTCHQVSHDSEEACQENSHPCPLQKVQENREPVTLIHQHLTDQGKRIIELNASPLLNEQGELVAVIEVSRDITERMHAEELLNEKEKRLHHLAHHDTLTGLPNRLLFDDRLKQALSKAQRNSNQVALFFLDLDHFKDVNDNLGHDFGDLLLIDIANRLSNCVRESDTVARLGGDEFLVLLDIVDSIEMVEAMAERICTALIHELTRGTYYQRVSASIGISIYPNDGTTGQDLLKNADLAMYRAKNHGKANFQFYSSHQTGFLFDQPPN